MSYGAYRIDPVKELRKAKRIYTLGDKDKAYRLFVLVFEHSNDEDLNLKIESCLWISMYFIFCADIEYRIEDVEILAINAFEWLEKAKYYCSCVEKNNDAKSTCSSLSWLDIRRYKDSKKIIMSALERIFFKINIDAPKKPHL